MYSQERLNELRAGPKTEQLFDLAAALICTARNQGTLKKSKKGDNARWFSGDKEFDDIYDDDDFGFNSRVVVGRVRRSGNGKAKSWNMRIVERFARVNFEPIINEKGEESSRARGDTSRVVYCFEWTSTSVIKALRSIEVKNSEKPTTSMDDGLLIPDLDENSLTPDMWNAAAEMEKVSLADCNILLKNVRESARTNNLFAGARKP